MPLVRERCTLPRIPIEGLHRVRGRRTLPRIPIEDLHGVRGRCTLFCCCVPDETQERLHGLIELDETALGKRKYNRGRRQRAGGVAWLQTILEVDESIGGRVAKRLRADLVPDRSFSTLSQNIQKHVQGSSSLQTDGWKGYSGIENVRSYSHDTVNHSETFVSVKRGRKVTINTLEGVHGALKYKAKALNLFRGVPTSHPSFASRVQELVFRFNLRKHKDLLFVYFLLLVSVFYPVQPVKDICEQFDRLSL